MTVPLVATLSAPLHDVRASLGAGRFDGTASALADVSDSLLGVSAAAGRSWAQAGPSWSGSAADSAGDFGATTVSVIEALSQRAGHLGATAGAAADAVARARAELDRIIDDFETRAAALANDLESPGAMAELVEEARRALDDALAVVDGLTDELDARAAAVAPSVGSSPADGAGSLGSGWGWGGGTSSGVGAGAAGLGAAGLGTAAAGGAASAQPRRRTEAPADPGVFGSGVAVHLPGGATSTAPNAVAASAVRHALTQLGVPYDWGGTTPGVGLDCSGLTQWAYREAGLELPRLAQEQDVGSAVDRGSLRPGDLAVWDGHVAMIVGDGLMVEAGDPVQLSTIRTTNAGQGFQGFWRPTA
jgi:cell wall-associated NlpC family hydrolase